MNVFKRIRNRVSNAGFSLIELIIVIAILAVLAAVLTPSLLKNMEDSRATKDSHAMSEVVSAVLQGTTSTDGYDELIKHASNQQVSCYIDQSSEANYTRQTFRENADGTVYYDFNDNARLLDEVAYYAAGRMYGVTITFEPEKKNNDWVYDLKNAKINKYANNKGFTLENCPIIYRKVVQTVGETITLDSQTYKHSEYTVFLRFGVADALSNYIPESLKAYGQYNGTNLGSPVSSSLATGRDSTLGNQEIVTPPDTNPGLSDNNDNNGFVGGGDPNVTPPSGTGGSGYTVATGGTYYVGVTSLYLGDYTGYTAVYSEGDKLPTPQDGDVYVLGDYEYRYNMGFEDRDYHKWFPKSELEVMASSRSNEQNVLYMASGWGVRVLENKSTYGDMVSKINGKGVTMLCYTFSKTYIKQAPKLSTNAVNLYSCFFMANSLSSAPDFTECRQITCMRSTFTGCAALTDGASIQLPSSVYNLYCAFNASGLTSAPVIPENVSVMRCMFMDCRKLEGLVVINAKKLTDMGGIFTNTTKEITLAGTSQHLSKIANGFSNVRLASDQS